MHNETFYIDGVDARSVGICLQRPVDFSEPIPICTTEQIPGRNGHVIFDEGSYENRTGTAECFALSPKDVSSKIRDINEFLLSGNHGYRKLETSDDPDYFWLARIQNGARTEQRMRRLAPFEITFDCKPQKFAKSGTSVVFVENGGTLYNSYGFDALPIISVYAKSNNNTADSSILTVGDTKISIKSQWWSYEALNDSLMKYGGVSATQIKENLIKIGVTPREFGLALDWASNSGMNPGRVKFWEYITECSDDKATEEDIASALIFTEHQWDDIIYNTYLSSKNRHLEIDCEEHTVHNAFFNLEHKINAPIFPVLKPGENTISWDGDIAAVRIIPRWWCL